MSQILLTTITNPFDPYGSRSVSQAIWTPGMNVADCVAMAFPLRPDDFDVAAGLNGAVVPEDQWARTVSRGDCITVCAVLHGGGGGGGGGGKNVVRAVAMLAVIIAAPYAAAAMGLISGGIGMAGMTGVMAYSAGAALSLTGMAVAAGVAVAGLALVNALLPPALPEVAGFSSGITNFAQSSPTYGWDQSATNQDQENIALPVLYGTARVKPPRIAKWIETVGDKQYLNMLFAVAGHAVDSIGDVEINKTPASMFTGVTTDVRLGTLDQTAIPWFHTVAAEQSIGRRISTTVQMLTENSLVDKIRVALVCPNGLFFANDGGGLDQVNLQIVVRYRQSGGAWDTRNITMAGSQNTALRQMVDIDVNPALTGPYEVEAYFSASPPSGSRYMTNCYVEYLQEVTNLEFTYPGVSLLAVRALATDQLSGAIPTVTCLATRSTVQVWDPDALISATAATASAKISLESGAAFVDFSIANALAPYTGGHITITDSAGKTITGWISAAGVGETTGANIVPNPTVEVDATGWSKWPSGASAGRDLVSTEGANGTGHSFQVKAVSTSYHYVWPPEMVLTSGALYRIGFWYRNSHPETVGATSLSIMRSNALEQHKAFGNIEKPGSWTNFTGYFSSVPSKAQTGQRVYIANYACTGYDNVAYVDEVSVQKVLAPSATGVTIVSSFGGSVRDWESVDAAFNPNAGPFQYTIDNRFQLKPATNPAWQDYDAFHNEDYGGDVPASRMTFADYQEWADWCTASGLALSIYFDSTINIEQADQMIGQAGRGRVVQKGTDFSCLIDKPGGVVQLFTVGNIKADSFRETFLDLKDRANVIEVTFFDTDSDHQRTTIELRSPLMAEGDDIRKTSVTLYGSVTRTLATNYGYYRLACNDYFLRTVEVEVDVDAIACQVNDVIAIQHDVPQWGYGGRVVAATANTLTLDRQVTVQAGQSYRVIVRNSEDDSLQERAVTTGPGSTDLLAIDPPWTGTPTLHDVYSFGRVNAVTKPFRVLSITRASDMTRKITCLEYRNEVYQIPTQIPAADQETDLAPVLGLSAQTVWTIDAHGNVSAGVHLYWHGYVLSWPVFQLIDSAWVQIGTANAPRFTVAGLQKNTQYTFAVYDTDANHQIAVATEASVAGPDNLTIAEELYSTSLSAGVKVKALLSWSEVPMAARYLVRYKKAADTAWIYNGDELANAAVILDLQAARYDFQVAAVLQSGAVSDWTQHSQEIYGLTSPPSDLSNVRFQIISNQLHIQWDLVSDLDVKIGGCIKVRHSSASQASATWVEAVEVGPPISGLTAQVVLPVMTGTYLLKAVDSGSRESLNAATFEIDEIDILGLSHVVTITEDPAFSGTKTSLTVRDATLTFDDARYVDQITENIDDWTTFDGQGGLSTAGQYLFSQVADAGSVGVYRVISQIAFAISAEVDLIDRRTDPIDSWEDLDGTTYSAIQPKFYIACTNDDPAGLATWGPWQQFHVGDYAGRGFKFKLEVSGGDGIHQIEISTLKMRIYQ